LLFKGYSIGGLFAFEPDTTVFKKTEWSYKALFGAMGLNQDGGEVLLQDDTVLELKDKVRVNGADVKEGTFNTFNGWTIIVREGGVVDFGRTEVKFEDSYSNYPQAAKDNAKRAVKANEELGNDCATQVGKVRAQQIIDGENLSMDTIKRTYSYLSRAKEYDNGDWTKCGTISYNLWGGDEMLNWCEKVIASTEEKSNVEMSEDVIAPEVVVEAPVVEAQPEVVAPVVVEQAPVVSVETPSNRAEIDAINTKMVELEEKLSLLLGENALKEQTIAKLQDDLTEAESKVTKLNSELGKQPIKKQTNTPVDAAQSSTRTIRVGNRTINV